MMDPNFRTWITSLVGGGIAVLIGVLASTNPPILELGDPMRWLLIIGGLASLGVTVKQSYDAVRASEAMRGDLKSSRK